MIPRLTRRNFLGGAATGAALAASSTAAFAWDTGKPDLLLLDPTLGTASDLGLGERFSADAVVRLAPDIVRQWRDGMQSRVANAGGALAIVRWSEAQVLAGLAREAGGRAEIQARPNHGFSVRLLFTGARP